MYRKRRGGIRLEDEADEDDKPEVEDNYNQEMMKHIEVEKHEKKQEAEKKKSDDLWADFMKDVEPSKPKPRPSSGLGSLSSVAKVSNHTCERSIHMIHVKVEYTCERSIHVKGQSNYLHFL